LAEPGMMGATPYLRNTRSLNAATSVSSARSRRPVAEYSFSGRVSSR
jgi:hypothetical protein